MREELRNNDLVQPYIFFENDINWRCGGGLSLSYAISGKFTVSGDRVKAVRLSGRGSQENSCIELQILSETRLQVIAVSENFFDPQVEWFKAGDVLGRIEFGEPEICPLKSDPKNDRP